MATSIILLSFAVSMSLFCTSVIRTGALERVSGRALQRGLKSALLLSLPFVALFGFAKLGDIQAAGGVWSFLAGMLVCNVIGNALQSPWQRATLMLALTVAYQSLPERSLHSLEPLLAGTLVWKCTDCIFAKSETQLEDLMPVAIWLSALVWSSEGSLGMPRAYEQQGLILGTISISLLLRAAERFIFNADELYFKRIAFAAIGGFGVLLITSKILVAGQFDKIAAVAGFGFLLAYALKSVDGNSNARLDAGTALILLTLIGIATVVSTRLFGNLGTFELAAAMVVAGGSRSAQLAAYFWLGRALTQSFVSTYNSNVTGINLNHTFTTAGLYAGFLLAAVLILIMRHVEERRLAAFSFLGLSVVAPIAAGYFVHAEPESSMLVAATVAAVILAVASRCFSVGERQAADSVILAPPLMALSGLLSADVLNLGDTATVKDRLVLLAVAAIVIAALSIVGRFLAGLTSGHKLSQVEQNG